MTAFDVEKQVLDIVARAVASCFTSIPRISTPFLSSCTVAAPASRLPEKENSSLDERIARGFEGGLVHKRLTYNVVTAYRRGAVA